MKWTCVQIEQALGLNRGDVAAIKVDTDGVATAVIASGVSADNAEKIQKLLAMKVKPDSAADAATISADILVAAKTAYNNWASLTAAQKDVVLKKLVWYVLLKEGALT